MSAALPLLRAEPTTASVAATAKDPALVRVLGLPERAPVTADLVAAVSMALRVRSSAVCPAGPGTKAEPCRRCGGTGEIVLRPSQVEVLREAWEYGGAFAPMQVGAGKSLPTFLLPTLLHARRPMLMIPASLFGKTRTDFARYAQDWRVRLPELVSYEEMSRDDRSTLLEERAPDLLILDEAHHLRRDSARTRKVARYIAAARSTAAPLTVVALSGTLMTASLKDYHHIAVWCLGDRAPLPVKANEAERWSAALDRDLGPMRRIGLGALADIPGGYHQWFRSRRGVVPTSGSDCNASIVMSPWRPEVPPALQQLLDEVDRSGMRPDDVVLSVLEKPTCLAELALGVWSRWDPVAPAWWLSPRSDWYAYERDVIAARLDGFDSPLQVINALDGDGCGLPHVTHGRAALAAWRAVKDLFVPNAVPVWVDDSILRQVVEYTRRADRAGEPMVVWVDPIAVGERLHELGLPYYGAGNNPEAAPAGRSICASVNAHREGKNLQGLFARSLSLSLPANADAWEQKIGRFHRAGQPKDTITIEYIESIEYHRDVIDRVLSQARADAAASGFAYKLTLADQI